MLKSAIILLPFSFVLLRVNFRGHQNLSGERGITINVNSTGVQKGCRDSCCYLVQLGFQENNGTPQPI